jgi:hypothetical protein
VEWQSDRVLNNDFPPSNLSVRCTPESTTRHMLRRVHLRRRREGETCQRARIRWLAGRRRVVGCDVCGCEMETCQRRVCKQCRDVCRTLGSRLVQVHIGKLWKTYKILSKRAGKTSMHRRNGAHATRADEEATACPRLLPLTRPCSRGIREDGATTSHVRRRLTTASPDVAHLQHTQRRQVVQQRLDARLRTICSHILRDV